MNLASNIKRIIATGLYTGYLPFAPATFGTLLGVLIYWLSSSNPWLYYPLLGVLIIAGIYSAGYYEKEIARNKNPKTVVVDEVVGYMITMVSFPFNQVKMLTSIKFMFLGFIMFRIFDTWKPYPVKKVEALQGGKGIMLDDIIAGIYANIFLQFIYWEPYALITASPSF